MIYFDDTELVIRNMARGDAEVIADAERAQDMSATAQKYLSHLQDQSEGMSVALVAAYRGEVAGYVNVYFAQADGPFKGRDVPEIVDFGVLEQYRRRGIGTRLMDVAEAIATGFSDTVCLGVGLHSGYGDAQRMYVRRGYVPDGSGVWYRDKVCEPYAACRNDDELVLYFSKKLI